jgi:hypothetical protein
MDKDQLIEELLDIRSKGFIKTLRIHDTGIGYTLEELLGVKENNIQLPDIGELELKAKRINSQSMLTLATKSPLPKGVNKKLFEEYKYLDSDGKDCLHSTVYGSRINQQGFRVILQGKNIVLQNSKNITAYWPLTIFDDILKLKSNKIILVFAITKGKPKSINEEFHFKEAYLLSDLNIDKFKTAIENDKLKIDIRIGSFKSGGRKGQYHDHGTGLRIHKRDFLQLYNNFEQLI